MSSCHNRGKCDPPADVWRASEGIKPVWNYIHQAEHVCRYRPSSDYDKLGGWSMDHDITTETNTGLNTINTYKDLQRCDLSYSSSLHWEGVLKNKYWSDLCFGWTEILELPESHCTLPYISVCMYFVLTKHYFAVLSPDLLSRLPFPSNSLLRDHTREVAGIFCYSCYLGKIALAPRYLFLLLLLSCLSRNARNRFI